MRLSALQKYILLQCYNRIGFRIGRGGLERFYDNREMPKAELLTKIITAMGLKREQVYICNTLKCRPPENRDPLTSEKDACRHFLLSQIEIIKPKVIVALGSHAAKELLNTDESIGKLRGVFHEYKTSPGAAPIKLMPTYHPAYLLRNYSPDNRRRVWEDMQLVMAELGLKLPKNANIN